MPEPFDKRLSIDTYIYNSNFLKKCNFLCLLNPNHITFITLLLNPIIAYYFLLNRMDIVIPLTILRTFLDILDGYVARRCNKTSKFGAQFDVLSDSIFLNLLLVCCSMIVSKKYPIIKLLLLVALIGITIFMTISIDGKDPHIIDGNVLFKILHDNEMITVPLYTYIAHYISTRYSD